MIKVLKNWFHRYFSDPQAVFLAIVLISSFTILMTMNKMLAPVLASLVIAYLLEGVIQNLQRWHIPRALAVFVVYSTFITLLMFIVVVLTVILENPILLYAICDVLAHEEEQTFNNSKNYLSKYLFFKFY